ncbi:kinase-like protein [Rhizoclosmatium globosum]|uniref:Kinase-like protein n=1 Tax=Rhizoclosmatium globosum TaxID=329046 RepID=A0A1Y2BP68_9FUNG|nr:kinase-like protein [Rhizoclosmatium globosum]ORY36548.1 kinase-like protein [Rhizoclosmatium globosum]|eukprot:ORY19352.1 kinase-like protein [Rhizoclosmatium globosum]
MGCCNTKEDPIDFTEEVNLTHFELLRAIGKGAYGKVKLVRHKDTKIQYALKYIDKKQCIAQKAVDYIIQERNLLEDIHCPFVCNLRYSFQDDDNMFMVIDLKTGGDLRYVMSKQGKLPEATVKFMTAEILLGILYLHSKKVVHRDLKPENILLDEYGHCCLTDFNIATYFKETKLLHAIAGSLSYMAPEILDKEKKGYNQVIDFWSMGIIIYEMLFSKRPFRGKTDEEVEEAIKTKDVVIPDNPSISAEATDIIKSFLTRPYIDRLGSKETGGDTRVTAHAWFKGYDWVKMEKLEGKPLFVPDSKSLNVDETIELEELLYSETQLKAKPRKIQKDGHRGSQLSIQHPKQAEKIDTQFKLFDHTKMAVPVTERKRSQEWDKKMSEIQRSASSLESNFSDLRETRSQFIFFEPDTMTIKSAMSSRSDLNSVGGDSMAFGGEVPAIPEKFKQSVVDLANSKQEFNDVASMPTSEMNKSFDQLKSREAAI